jgi:hypothetical protein
MDPVERRDRLWNLGFCLKSIRAKRRETVGRNQRSREPKKRTTRRRTPVRLIESDMIAPVLIEIETAESGVLSVAGSVESVVVRIRSP